MESAAIKLNESDYIYLDKHEVEQINDKNKLKKRMRDVILSFFAILGFSPIMIVTAIAIFIENPKASPIFIQKRVGKDKKIFKFYKFRSMVPDAEKQLDKILYLNEMDGPAFKLEHDPRITKVGQFIRKTGIDELPQFFNVLKGDMSLVGPRPPLPREVKMYNEYQLQRLWVKPGITCYWQIQPNRNDIPFDDWVKLDLDYIQSPSFKEDTKILVKTAGTFFEMSGK